MKTIYQTTMINTGARQGTASSPDGSLVFQMVSPVEMGGNGTKPGTNPEQLFAATYSSCYNGALEHILKQAKVEYESTTVTAEISLIEDPSDKGFKIGAKLTVSVKGITLDQAEKYAQLAHKFCPYSKAIKGNVDVEIKVV
jgi:lipoyl-dependent peroxiredoxin